MTTIGNWNSTWKDLGVADSDEALYTELVERYSDRARSYHTLQHLEECFARLDEARSAAERVLRGYEGLRGGSVADRLEARGLGDPMHRHCGVSQ